ncbi:MAG: transposase [Terriglobia bacterium]
MFYHLLFTASAAALLKVAADPKHLGAEIGILAILHTWGQNLLAHPHVHCVIPGGRDLTRWRSLAAPALSFFSIGGGSQAGFPRQVHCRFEASLSA